MNYETLYNTVQAYTENTESLFLANIPVFVQQAETRVYNAAELPAIRRNVTGTVTTGNPYLTLPMDYLATYSIAAVDASGNYTYLLNKDTNFMREAYPQQSTSGLPRYYALFGPESNNVRDLGFIMAPTPDQDYTVELHYFYYPPTIVKGQITGLNLTVAGNSYTTGVYQNVALTGGSGSAATADIVVVGGVVTSCTLQFGGHFYVVGDVLSCSTPGTTGTAFTATVTSVSNSEGVSWLGDNYDPALLYGSMREAMLFMKQEQDLVTYYETKFQEAIQQLVRLGDGLEGGDAYRDGMAKVKVSV